jgi:tetratricopeptide (TPR) repeat protein
MKEYDLSFYFDENLHEVANTPSDIDMHVHELKVALDTMQDPLERTKALGQIGMYLRILRELIEARDYLLKALEMIERHEFDISLKVQQQLRLAHVYQWLGDFDHSNKIFDELSELSKSSNLGYLEPFLWQHKGKNHFDQQQWKKALECFEKSLEIREAANAPEEQIESARLAIRATIQRMN